MENSLNNAPKDLGQNFWNDQYIAQSTGWDLGQVSPPLKAYIDQITDKNIKILIPGCGNSYEAEYLLEQGFNNVNLIDIAPELVQRLKTKFKSNSHINIILGDFFEHDGEYDLILEQTFFCALDPILRKNYVEKMANLLNNGGKIAGLLFSRIFEIAGPPFGGTREEYQELFKEKFDFKVFDACYNSFEKRSGSELFVVLVKK
ncbi:methyltransferase domain-containing protein [Daejeonella sp.]|jgi:SAM-dependent methyltransferase|uniref:methyltransferase domain-containing protein n=1 Tax=Daejeonella sp. TaxID=2805397 RepID=UPI0037BE75CE